MKKVENSKIQKKKRVFDFGLFLIWRFCYYKAVKAALMHALRLLFVILDPLFF